MSGRRPSVRVGVDVVSVPEVAASVDRFGDRYLRRIYTAHELACCVAASRPRGYACDSLAARFAAKEAVVKVLRPRGARPAWRSIEVRRDPAGWCEIRLTGRAAALAREAGIDEIAVSLTHENALAAAVVVGRCAQGPGDEERP